MNNNEKSSSIEAQEAKTPVWEIIIWVVWIIGGMTLLGCFAFMRYYFSNTSRGSDYFRKDELKKELKIKISNGADLEVIEHVFSERNKNPQNDRIWNNHIEKDYYDNNTTLLQVLKDLRSDYFDSIPYTVPPTIRDTAYYSRLSMIIDEYMQKTPFDGLEEGQMALFINLQKSLGDDYERVEEKITRIADELGSKNALVDKYLNNSNDSYRLSHKAFIATLVFGGFTLIFGFLELLERIRSRKERRAS